jgi:hypothetical protein
MTEPQDYNGTEDICVLPLPETILVSRELMFAHARIEELEAALDGLLEIADPAWNPIAFSNARDARDALNPNP